VRPRRLVVVTGTGTEVGKTWVASALARRLVEAGRTVCARKPAQSFEHGDDGGAVTDAHVLGSATGEAAEVVCPHNRWYPVPMAPPMAAASLGRGAPSLAELVSEIESSWPGAAVDIGLVEGAGGVASPLGVDGDTADLARALGADSVLLVADAGLGTINLVRMSVGALAPLPVTVYLNRFVTGDDLHEANLRWLRERDRFDVVAAVADLAAAGM